MKYNEFPEIEIPEWLTGPKWEDASWHNDACALSTYRGTDADGNTKLVRVWVDYERPELRESVPPFRFFVQTAGRLNPFDDDWKTIYAGDDEAQARAAAQRALAEGKS